MVILAVPDREALGFPSHLEAAKGAYVLRPHDPKRPKVPGRIVTTVAKAKELCFTGDMIDAAEAYRIGLVNAVVPPGELLAHATAMLRKMLANGPVAVALSIEAVVRGMELPLDDALRLEADQFGLLAATEDMREGMRAFLEKRPPNFTGR